MTLDLRLISGVESLGYREPTPVQAAAIPPLLAGHDVVALAATGTGKTAAFVLPLFQRVMDKPRGVVRALVLSPTRELVEQTHMHIRHLASLTKLRSATVYGGVGIVAQTARLRAGVEIVVGCPGRILDHIRRGTLDLSHVEFLVLDEADSLFEHGFLPDVRTILQAIPPTCQRALFSATMPQAVQGFITEVLHQPVMITVDTPRPANTVEHALYPVAAHLRTPLLKAFLRSGVEGSVVVFVRTRHGARRLWQQLANVGFRVTCLQGKLSQRRRQAALEGFRDGHYDVLVATDVAARGLDISQVTHVVNYDVPATADAYIHRVGRTGRAMRCGIAMTFVTPADEHIIRGIERILNEAIPRCKLSDFDYGAALRSPEGARPAIPPRQARLPGGRKPQLQTIAEDSPRPRRPRPARQQVPASSHTPAHNPVSSAGARNIARGAHNTKVVSGDDRRHGREEAKGNIRHQDKKTHC